MVLQYKKTCSKTATDQYLFQLCQKYFKKNKYIEVQEYSVIIFQYQHTDNNCGSKKIKNRNGSTVSG